MQSIIMITLDRPFNSPAIIPYEVGNAGEECGGEEVNYAHAKRISTHFAIQQVAVLCWLAHCVGWGWRSNGMQQNVKPD